ncbi:hypothetical protein [Laspinema olomoucense]|uniref:Uncharacterized protein n=1 Tax=Laspinema olomoucense D3b TaxID=2953688 RepID=A0ABT2NC90_9CYAN|nr:MULTISPECIES: hypothetical protein [unclassified Laspinema]MCT7970436.1 hypothetical protein [Laspinema sp. D3d]MCT7980318.1 hypothetical protein [Laspinema sp. D3b]MCT7993904.1 hypothetical protein [Laspinema sp. D3c]
MGSPLPGIKTRWGGNKYPDSRVELVRGFGRGDRLVLSRFFPLILGVKLTPGRHGLKTLSTVGQSVIIDSELNLYGE